MAANGLAYGPFRDGQGPYYNPPVIPLIEHIDEDLRFLSTITRRIRTYSTTDTQSNIPHLAKPFGISVAQGIELGKNDAANEKQIAIAVQMAREGLVESLIVGNEVVSAGILSKAKLIEYVRKVRRLTPKHVPVTTAEAWDVWNNNPELAATVDFVMAHFYPFWEGQPIDRANQILWRSYETLQRTLRRTYPMRDLPIVIGETGWPSGGATKGSAVPSPSNQRRFLQEFTAFACAKSVPFYFFQAFDEEWKWKEGMPAALAVAPPRDRSFAGNWIGASWGLYQSNGTLKAQLTGLLGQPSPGSRLEREVFTHGRLAAHYAIKTSGSSSQRSVVAMADGALQIRYPGNQPGTVVSIAVGEPKSSPPPWKDFSQFHTVSFELRGSRGQENVLVGIKDGADADDHVYNQVLLRDISTQFQTYTIPLSDFASRQLPIADRLKRLHRVLEFFFDGAQAQTVYVRNVRYVASN